MPLNVEITAKTPTVSVPTPARSASPKQIKAAAVGTPRGVAIVTKTPVPTVNDVAARQNAIHRAAVGTPRGVAINTPTLQPTVNDRAQALRQTLKSVGAKDRAANTAFIQKQNTPSGPLYAAITHIPGVGPEAAKVGLNLGKDILNLPVGTLEGATQLGLAGVKAQFLGDPKPLLDIAKGAAQSDPLVNLATGNPSKALSLAEAHPLGALLDFGGVTGLAGRAAGALARSGALGEEAARAAQLARVREMAPGIPGTASMKPYSRNALTQAVQKYAENHPEIRAHLPVGITDRLGVTGTDAAIRQQAASMFGAGKAEIARQVRATAEGLKATKPADKVSANVAPYKVAFGQNADLPSILKHYEDVRAGSEGPLSPATQQTLDQHIKNLRAAVKTPNLDNAAIAKDAEAYAARQAALEAQKVQLGLHEEPELEHALEKQYALQRIPGTHYMTRKDEIMHPESRQEIRELGAQVRLARSDLNQATKTANVDLGAHQGASRAISDASKRLPVHPVNDALGSHLIDLREAVNGSKAATAAEHQSRIAALQDALHSAEQDLKLAKANPKRLGGVVVEDPAALPVHAGKFRGMQLRELPPDEIRAFMAAHGDNPSYLRMTNPLRERPVTLHAIKTDAGAAGSATGKVSTEMAAHVGDFLPGRASMVRSQLGDVFKVGSAQMEQNFLDRFGLKDDNGNYFTPRTYQHAAEEYTARTGVKVVPVSDAKDQIVLVPKAAADELRKQFKLENPGKGMKLAMKANRAFRDSVLPTSPKLPVMHTVENITRGALAGATPQSYALARATLGKMGDVEAARLRELAAPGGMGGHQLALDDEDLGRLTTNRSAARKALGAPVKGWQNVSHNIIAAQRALERHAQLAALGVHMRQTLQELGHGPLEANLGARKFADELAQEYSKTARAEDAGRFSHQTMGQYNNFTAGQRKLISRAAPFLPWYRNAAKLVWKDLPTNHPLKTAFLNDTAVHNAPAWNAQHKGLPADLQSAYQMGPGHYLDVGKFTPIGIEKNPLAEGVPLLFPQYSGAALAMYGLDPFGNPMKGPNTPYGKTAVAPLTPVAALHSIDQLLESFGGPAGALSRALQSHGATLYNTSMPMFGSVQRRPNAHGPGGVLGGLEKSFNPFAGVWFNPSSGSSSTTGGFSRGFASGGGGFSGTGF